jgi:hypothetical protein
MRVHADLASAVSEGPLSLRAESTKLRLAVVVGWPRFLYQVL